MNEIESIGLLTFLVLLVIMTYSYCTIPFKILMQGRDLPFYTNFGRLDGAILLGVFVGAYGTFVLVNEIEATGPKER
jgi:hypothetical protein